MEYSLSKILGDTDKLRRGEMAGVQGCRWEFL